MTDRKPYAGRSRGQLPVERILRARLLPCAMLSMPFMLFGKSASEALCALLLTGAGAFS